MQRCLRVFIPVYSTFSNHSPVIPSWWWSPSLSCLFLSANIQIVLSVIFRRSKITVFLLWCGCSTSVVPDGRAFSWFDFCLETIDICFKILIIIIKFCSFRMSKLDICLRMQVFSKQVTLSGFNSQSGILVYAGEEWGLTSVAGSNRFSRGFDPVWLNCCLMDCLSRRLSVFEDFPALEGEIWSTF